MARRRRWLLNLALRAAAAGCLGWAAGPGLAQPKLEADPIPRDLIGYSEYRTNLPGGRLANVATTRAYLVRADGSDRRPLGKDLARQPYTWTQFAGWSPDGQRAVVTRGWESPQNAAFEEKHKQFRLAPDGWLLDQLVIDVATGKATNVTAVGRVSHYNTSLFFWPKDPARLGFLALRKGDAHLFRMDADGRNKKDLTPALKGLAYGYNVSPDGERLAYHKDNQVYIAEADGGNPRPVQTDALFNHMPQWSPDGRWLLFASGQMYDSHPVVVKPDGTGPRKLADRQGFKGAIEFLDNPDVHGATNLDVPVWSPDGKSVLYTARVGEGVELMRVTLEGQVEQLTRSPAGVLNYTPRPSPDGKWIVFGSDRSGTRQLYVTRVDGTQVRAITAVKPGWGAMWPHWQRRPAGKASAPK